MKTMYRVAAAMSLCVSTMASAVDYGPLNALISPVTSITAPIASSLVVTYVPPATAILAGLVNNPVLNLVSQGSLPGLPPLPGL